MRDRLVRLQAIIDGRKRPPSWIVLLLLSALLFLAGSASFGLGHAPEAAVVGVLGALAAVVVIAAFAG